MTQFSSKRIRGSAVVGQEGVFIFTPYVSKSDEEKTMKLLAVSKFASLWSTPNSYCIRLKIPKKDEPMANRVGCYGHGNVQRHGKRQG